MKKSILRGFAVTSFVFLSMWGVSGLTSINLFTAFDPISQALEEFELTDIVFSKLRPDPVPDPRIVIVNIGQLSRREVAQQVSTISQYKPKVIGIDSFFNCEGGLVDTVNCPQLLDTLGNLMLSSAIQEAGNVVLVSKLLQSDSLFDTKSIDVYDSIEHSDRMFTEFATTAYANLPTNASYQEDVKVCKSIIPKMEVDGKTEIAFSVMLAMKYDSLKARRFLARDNYEEVINFRGNIEIDDVKNRLDREAMANTSEFRSLCFVLDWSQLESGQFDGTLFENSVVILGYLGDYLGDPAWEDKFFSPLNSKVAGRANPDMFGPVIHANVVAMILNEDYINEIPLSAQVTIAVLVCFLNVLLFRYVDVKFPALFDGLSVILQIVQIILVSLLVVYAFSQFNLKLELALTLGCLALIGPCFDIAKSVENSIQSSLTTKRQEVLTPEKEEIL